MTGLDEAGFPLRLSAGVSTYPYDGAAATQLLRAADQALYHAKARGKNQVVGFREILRGALADGAARGAQRSQPQRLERGRLGARRRDGCGGCDLGRGVARRRARAARQGDRIRRRRDGHQHLEGRRPSARRHDQARAARRRSGRGLRLPDRGLPGHAGGARDGDGEVDLVPRRRGRQRRGIRAARAADERRDARPARRPRRLVGPRGDLRHAPAPLHDRGRGARAVPRRSGRPPDRGARRAARARSAACGFGSRCSERYAGARAQARDRHTPAGRRGAASARPG